MAITLGGITLNDTLLWENKLSYAKSGYSRRVTLQGRVIMQSSPINTRLITLTTMNVSGGTIGYFTFEQIEAIRDFENALSVISFVYESDTMTVMIQPGGINVEAVVPRPNHSADDWFLGSINLIEVGA